MTPKPPVIVADLFPVERRELLDLLAGLSSEAWQAPTVCAGWSVKDLVAHILAGDLHDLSSGRDGYAASLFATPPDWPELVATLNRWNEVWIEAARRLSPQVLVELLEFGGVRTLAYFRSVDPLSLGPTVSWAGSDPAPHWLHIAREYSERWTHQEQVREAVRAPGLRRRELFWPVLNTFVHALPRTYQDVSAAEGTHLKLIVTGEAGDTWSLVRHHGRWALFDEVQTNPISIVTLDQDTAWRLFTRGIDKAAASSQMTIAGDEDLASVILTTVAIIA